MAESEAPYIRAVALFGLYTFYFTQPSGTAPPLHRVAHIPIPLGQRSRHMNYRLANYHSDQYASLKALPRSLVEDQLLPLKPIVCHILSMLLCDEVFHLVPSAHLCALNPRDLPREIFIDKETITPGDLAARKRKGRPTRLDKVKKAKVVLYNLERWLEDTSCSQLPPALTQDLASEENRTAKNEVETTLGHYQNLKSYLLNGINFRTQSGELSERYTAVQRANEFVLDRLKATQELLASDGVLLSNNLNTVARVEHAVKDFIEGEGQGGGILSLLEGAE
jgi:hypothetical protein